MVFLALAALLAAAVTLCGYTTIRMPVKRKEKPLHIACVGDSITYGCTLLLFFRRRYPAVLQKLVGADAQVAVFGVNDRTLQDTGNKPYRRESAFLQSQAYQPDVVIILLGTNDSKDCNWISAEAFRQQYVQLLSGYRHLASHPRVLACTPPCAFAPMNRFFYITNDAKLERIPEIVQAVKTVADTEGAELVELYALTADHRELFGPDGLHPSAAGARAIAEEIARIL